MIVTRLLGWTGTRVSVPVVWAQEDATHTLDTPTQPFLEFIYVIAGNFRISVVDRQAEVESGDVALVNAHFGNRADVADRRIRYECVSFTIAGDRDLADLGIAPVLEVRRMADPSLMHDLYLRVSRQYWSPAGPLRGYRLKAEVLQFLTTMLEQALPSGSRSTSAETHAVERVCELIRERYGDPDLGLAEMAKTADVSPVHLCRTFRRRTGVPPVRYLQDVRMKRASELLLRSGVDIKRIAFLAGYRDQLYFSRVFRKNTGMSPSEYRARRNRT